MSQLSAANHTSKKGHLLIRETQYCLYTGIEDLEIKPLSSSFISSYFFFQSGPFLVR